MSKQRLTWLLEQHLSNNATEQERAELLAIVKANGDEALFTAVLSEMMQRETAGAPVDAEPWQKMVQDIVAIDKTPVTHAGKKARVFTLYRWVAAAAVILLIGAGVYFFMNRPRNEPLAVGEKNVAQPFCNRGEEKRIAAFRWLPYPAR